MGESKAGLGRPFWLVWTASSVSALGDGIRYVAFPLLAASLTRDPQAVAIVAAAGFLPWPLFGLLGGAVVDRVDRRQLMWRTDVLRGVLVGAFAALVAAQWAPVAALAIVSFVLGALQTLFDNAASAIVPMLVRRPVIEPANSWLMSGQTVMTTLVGAPVGGLLFGLGAVVPIATDAITFTLAAVLVGCVVGSYSARAPGVTSSTVWQDIGEGLRWLWHHRLLRTLCAQLAIMNATIAAGEAVLVLYALEVLGIGTVGYSLLLVAFAVGGVGGTVVGPAIGRILGLRGAVALAGLGQAAALAVTAVGGAVLAAATLMCVPLIRVPRT